MLTAVSNAVESYEYRTRCMADARTLHYTQVRLLPPHYYYCRSVLHLRSSTYGDSSGWVERKTGRQAIACNAYINKPSVFCFNRNKLCQTLSTSYISKIYHTFLAPSPPPISRPSAPTPIYFSLPMPPPPPPPSHLPLLIYLLAHIPPPPSSPPPCILACPYPPPPLPPGTM